MAKLLSTHSVEFSAQEVVEVLRGQGLKIPESYAFISSPGNAGFRIAWNEDGASNPDAFVDASGSVQSIPQSAQRVPAWQGNGTGKATSNSVRMSSEPKQAPGNSVRMTGGGPGFDFTGGTRIPARVVTKVGPQGQVTQEASAETMPTGE